MSEVTIEYVCYGNIYRSPMFEAVTSRIVDDKGLAGKIRASSSGVCVDKLRSGDFTDGNTEFFLNSLIQLEPELMRVFPEKAPLVNLAKHTQKYRDSYEPEQRKRLARLAMNACDRYAVHMRDSVLEACGIRHAFAPPTQTQTRNDVTLVVGMADHYAAQARAMYPGSTEVVSFTMFRKAVPPSFGFSPSDYLELADLAAHTVPDILGYATRKR
jgi:protein-tyrosine-phosphatase